MRACNDAANLAMGPGNDAANLAMGPGNDAGASTDCVRQARPKEVSTDCVRQQARTVVQENEPLAHSLIATFGINHLFSEAYAKKPGCRPCDRAIGHLAYVLYRIDATRFCFMLHYALERDVSVVQRSMRKSRYARRTTRR